MTAAQESWLRARMEVPAGSVEDVEALFETLGAVAVSLEDARDQPLLEPDPGTVPLWAQVVVSGLFPADDGLPARLDAARRGWFEQTGHALPELQLAPLAEAAWTEAWLQHARPLQFGEQLWIGPEPLPAAATFPGARVLLAPGLAFGTGSHPTTRGCLACLAARPPQGAEVIDFGCGSGILALAALALGAKQVLAVDHDPQALAASAENARRNAMADRLSLHASLPASARCDLLLANVLAGPLIDLAGILAGSVRPGGRVVLSGILAAQVDAVIEAWPDFRFAVHLDQGWACLDGDSLR